MLPDGSNLLLPARALLLVIRALPLGKPAFGVRQRARIVRVKVFGQPLLVLVSLLLRGWLLPRPRLPFAQHHMFPHLPGPWSPRHPYIALCPPPRLSCAQHHVFPDLGPHDTLASLHPPSQNSLHAAPWVSVFPYHPGPRSPRHPCTALSPIPEFLVCNTLSFRIIPDPSPHDTQVLLLPGT